MKKIQLDKNWRFFKKDGKIIILDLITSKQLEILDDIDAVFVFLNQLKQGVDEKDLKTKMRKQFPSLRSQWIRESLAALRENNLLKKERSFLSDLNTDYLDGLDRQLDFLEGVFPLEGKYEKQTALKQARVCILGLGTVAQYLVQALVASGIENYVCVDFDIVEERNIGRQPLLRKGDVGKYKSSVISNYLNDVCHEASVDVQHIMIKGVGDVANLIQDSDLVLHCCDYPRFLIHRWINEACLKLSKPNLLVYSGRVGPLSIPFKTACYGCLEMFYRQHLLVYDELAETINAEGMGRYPELAVVGALTSALAAKEVIAFILGMQVETQNGFFDIAPTTLKITRHKLEKADNCDACGYEPK